MLRLLALFIFFGLLKSSDKADGQIGYTPMINKPPLACGAVAHGATTSRVMYSAASVTEPTTCTSETQTATCFDGTLSAYSGTFTNASCSASRTRYSTASTTCPASCAGETQTQSCSGGSCGGWSGTYTNASCTQSTTSQNRTMYASSSTTCPSACASESQSRTCSVSSNTTPGTWGAWSGTYANASCTQNTNSQNRTMYSTSSTTCPTACAAESQSRTCSVSVNTTPGTWGGWSGTYANASCTHNTTSQNRPMYASSSTTCPTACASENQSRTCSVSVNTTPGTWGGWSGSYGNASCTQNGTSQNANYYTCWGMCTFSCALAGTRSRTCSVSSDTSPGSWGSWSPNGAQHYTDSNCSITY